MKNMMNLIQKSHEMSKQPEVRVKRKDAMIVAKRVIEVSCKTNLGQIKSKRVIPFQIGEVDVPDGVLYTEMVCSIRKVP